MKTETHKLTPERSARISRHTILPLLALFAALFLPESASAQSGVSDSSSALAVGTAFLKAVQRADWNSAAALMDVRPIDPMRLQAADNARRMRRQGPPTAESMMASDPNMPREVADYVAQRAASNQRANYLAFEFANVTDPDSLVLMPLAEAAARWLEAQDERYQVRRADRDAGCADSGPTPVSSSPRRVLGVAVHEDAAYVLFDRGGEQAANQLAMVPRILVLSRSAGTWKVHPSIETFSPHVVFVQCLK